MTVNYLNRADVLWIHNQGIRLAGGSHGLRDNAGFDAAINQPRMTFGGQDLYPTIPEKAAALAYSLVRNHPFVDGNKRTSLGAMDLFLMHNGFELVVGTDEGETFFVSLAAGEISREQLVEWIKQHIVPAQYQ